jgi:hypothetical protein
MNRTFIASFTPARARLLRLMSKHTEIALSDELLLKAKEGELTSSQCAAAGLETHEEREATQFVLDTNFRAGLPIAAKERARADRVIKAAIQLAEIEPDDVVYIEGSLTRKTLFGKNKANKVAEPEYPDDHITDPSFEKLLPLRKKLLIMNLDSLDRSASHEFIGKMFPRIVCVGGMLVQYSFAFGSQNSTSTRMGEILYPAVEASISHTPWKASERRSMLAMGVYPDLVDDFTSTPKKLAGAFTPKSPF